MSEYDLPNPAEIESEDQLIEAGAERRFGDQLRDDEVGGRVVRGGAIRFTGYAVGSLAVALSSVFLLRYLGVSEFGRYSSVMALITIVLGVTESGLNTVGNRELALTASNEERRKLLSELLGIRLVLTPLGVIAVVAFAILADYGDTLVLGTAVAGVGATLLAVSSSFSLTLAVDLKIAGLTALEVIKQVTPTIAALALIVAGASLLPFFAIAIPGAIIAIALTPMFAGRDAVAMPSFRAKQWMPLIRKALPVAIASTIAVLYLRVLTVLMFMPSSDYETGLFSTSVRIVELILGIPWLVFGVALPVLSVASDEDRQRTKYVFQRMIDVGLIAAVGISVALCLAASTVILIAGGSEYDAAVPVLQIQSFALIAAFVTQACMFAAIAMNMARELVIANVVGLVTIVALGVPMISAWDAEGAAIATLIAEFATAFTYWVLVGRGPGERPSFREAWKPALGGGLGVGAALLLGGPPLLQALVSLVVFSVVVVATRAVPTEVVDALRRRRAAD